MSIGEARYIKKKVKTGTVDCHPTDSCLIVNYEVEALILGDDGQPMIGDSKKCQKLIRFHSLNPATNCAALAKDVINKCKLIHPSKQNEVQHLLRYLQLRKQCAPSMLVKSNEALDVSPFEETPAGGKNEEKANLLDLEDYIELLYEEMPDKIKGSNLILRLCRDSANLDELTTNESLLSVLSRVLREDWKRSLELAANLVGIFQIFSEYRVFHNVIVQQKISSLTLEIVTQEMRKLDDSVEVESPKEEDTDKKQQLFRSRLPVPRSMKSAQPEASKPKSQIPVKNNHRRHSAALDENVRKLDERAGETCAKKQDQLLTACFTLLLNISENEKIEDQIRKRGIVKLLVQALNRKSTPLLGVVVKYLHKLSVYKENKDAMAQSNIVEKLPRLLLLSSSKGGETTKLLDNLLPLLFNLSFDRKLCEQMIRVGFLPEMVKLADQYRTHKNRKYVLGLLYHFTMDDRVKSMFAYMNSMNVVIDMLVQPQLGDDRVLKALCVNLTLNSKNAETFCEGNCRAISAIMEKAFAKQDPICMKIMRNIVTYSNGKQMFEIYASEVAKCVKLYIQSNKHFACECIGFLANLSTTDVDFNALFKKFQLFPLIKRCFTDAEFVTDDVRLEFLVLLGTVAYDENVAENLYQNDVLALLIKLIKDKQEDDEMVLQSIFVFYQVLQHPLTRDYVTKRTDAPLYFIDLLHDNNPSIRKLCRACLDIVKDFDDKWTERVKMEKFQWHNSHWLEMIQNRMMDTNDFDKDTADADDDAFPQYDLGQQSLMFQSAGSHLSLSVDGSVEMLSNPINSEESSQSISEYNSDADFDLEFTSKKLAATPGDEKFDFTENFGNLIIENAVARD